MSSTGGGYSHVPNNVFDTSNSPRRAWTEPQTSHPHEELHQSPIKSPESSSDNFNREVRPNAMEKGRTMSGESWWSRNSSKLRNLHSRNISSPWVLDADDKTQLSNKARYNRRHTRRRLAVNILFQLLITCVLCAALVGNLVGFERRSRRGPLNGRSKHIFNAVSTGLSLSIGINIASSLRSYAKLLRWRLLATGWKSLEEFDLILSAESQVKVIQLLFAGRRRKSGFPYVSRTQICCFLWLAVNLAAQVLVAITSLNYSIDTSDKFVNDRPGWITVVDFSIIKHQSDTAAVTLYTQQNAAQSYGIEGEDYDVSFALPNNRTYAQAIYTDSNNDYYDVQLFNWNYNQPSIGSPSDQFIETSATCVQYAIVGGASDNTTQVTYENSQTRSNVTVEIGGSNPGSTTFALKDYTSCGGDRCATVYAYQAADDVKIFDPSFYICESFVYPVAGADSSNLFNFSLPNTQAAIFAGSIASTGDTTGVQHQIYDSDSVFGADNPKDAQEMKYIVSAFTAVAIAAMAYNGPTQNVWGEQPSSALEMSVEWRYFIPSLSVIPFLQAIACFIVINWANKAIIRDDSYLAMAQLYRPVLDKLGDGGCFLTREAIVHKDIFQSERVIYGYTDPDPTSNDENKVRHIGIIFEHDNSGHDPTIQRAWPDGYYNGPDDRDVSKRPRRLSV